jgi:C4-dicarboxylate-specific signal transduction histidine kinase
MRSFLSNRGVGSRLVRTLALSILVCVWSGAQAELLPPVQVKVEKYKQKLVEWAANPAIIAVVKEANVKGALAGVTNAKWDELTDKDPEVSAILSTSASVLLRQWGEDKGINKLYVRDKDGNLVAASNKPLLYNSAPRTVFKEAMKGVAWAANDIKPDVTTQIKSVQLSAPVKDGGKVIGVIHSAVTVE